MVYIDHVCRGKDGNIHRFCRFRKLRNLTGDECLGAGASVDELYEISVGDVAQQEVFVAITIAVESR